MRKLTILAVLFAMFFAITTNAQPFTGKGGFDKPGVPGFIMEKLNLTEAQKEKMKEIHFANEKKEISIEAEIKLARLEMKEALTSDNIDKEKVFAMSDKITKLTGEMKKSKLSMMLEINDLLNDAQKKMWKEHMLMMGKERMFERKMEFGDKNFPKHPGKNMK